MYHGGGGFVFNDIYNMPSYLRLFYYQELIDVKKEENKDHSKAEPKSNAVHRAGISPKNPRFKQ